MSEIWDDVKIYIRDELKSGEIIDILKVNKRKFYTCAPGYPAEYCSKENGLEIFIFIISSPFSCEEARQFSPEALAKPL